MAETSYWSSMLGTDPEIGWRMNYKALLIVVTLVLSIFEVGCRHHRVRAGTRGDFEAAARPHDGSKAPSTN
jgi:hypothetical protein